MLRSFTMPSVVAGAALAATLLAGTTGAQADIIFDPGNHPQSNEVNILFDTGETGALITGEVGHTGVLVDFSTLTGQTLKQNAQGQASIQNAAGDSSQLTS